jgi:curved DNA-binding protein
MDFKDYYAILGVPENADAKVIKKAYQQIAKKDHPDKNPGDKQAEERFKEAAEAYQALSDEQNRKKYDELRRNYQQWQSQGGDRNFDWNRWQAQPGSGGYTRTMNPEEFAGMFGGAQGQDSGGFSDFFSTIFGFDGMGMEGARSTQSRRGRTTYARKGQDFELDAHISLEEAYAGASRLINLQDKRIEAKIPQGVRTGSKVRVAGQGGMGTGGGRQGDLYLLITVDAHPYYQKDGDDLSTKLSLDFFTAVLGGEAYVQTLDGMLKLKIPPMTQSGQKFRLKDKGLPKLEDPQQRGDHYAIAEIVLPDHLSQQEIDVLRDLAQQHL